MLWFSFSLPRTILIFSESLQNYYVLNAAYSVSENLLCNRTECLVVNLMHANHKYQKPNKE